MSYLRLHEPPLAFDPLTSPQLLVLCKDKHLVLDGFPRDTAQTLVLFPPPTLRDTGLSFAGLKPAVIILSAPPCPPDSPVAIQKC